MNDCPCENCITFAMCIGKSLSELTRCPLVSKYMNVDDVYQRHSHMWIVKLTFRRPDNFSLTEPLNKMMRDLEHLMAFKRRTE